MATGKRQRAGKGTSGSRRVQRQRVRARRAERRRTAAGAEGQRERREPEAPRILRTVQRAAIEAPAVKAGTPLAVAVAALVEDTIGLVRTLVAAPFRLADALRKLVVA